MGGSHHYSTEAQPKKDQDLDEIKTNRVPLHYRDQCAHLLIPLNKCRRETFYMPESCGHERHTFEQCQHIMYEQRVAMKKEMKAKEAAAAATSAAAM
eukprot:CAMPEP_0198141970 /NCGR_PEP_ID=MMETSP1443-20131203/4878_1 /TAXON_ID=186043 /ORGANISM="Entomoneis sp., Strain CCMP2396" /LENGTH=96 /DNA_ID=CAMNT_0043804879 /DNA_START=141 /DNA_END=431 /DNA_ORIENTATION=+